MKALALPLMLLLFCASCAKQEMPTPVDANANHSQARVFGDVIQKIGGDPGQHLPLTNFVGPKNPKPNGALRVLDSNIKIHLNPGEHLPVPNGVGLRN